jgi:TolB protein
MSRSNMRRRVGVIARAGRLSVLAVVAVTSLLIPGFGHASDTTFTLISTIAFSSSRDNPTLVPAINAAEIYLVNPDGSDPRRLTDNDVGDGFATLSPDGRKIVFDSNRNRGEGEPINTSDLFLMNTDGTEQTLLTRGGSPPWAPDSKSIAFHASALGTGTPLRTDPGAATTDSDIFIANVDDLLSGVEQPRNITNTPNMIDDDPDWSPDGQIVYTAHDVGDEGPNFPNPPFISNSAEIYVRNADGTGTPERLTLNAEEERATSWSPDGTRIAFMCRIGGGAADFEICVMSAHGSDQVQLTNNTVFDGTPTWSPDGQQIAFSAQVGVPRIQQVFVVKADGTEVTQITSPPGANLLANWGELRVRIGS